MMGTSSYAVLMFLWIWITLMSAVSEGKLHPEALDAEMRDRNGGIAGKRWAVLVAGSNGYENYRHQADVCHAYQILRNGGLKQENIVVFMYDDIAFDPKNPRPGIIINRPNGEDVYHGVPKDYTGKHVNVNNLYAVILGNKSALTGGSGKVVDSGPDDFIFVYYADHGAPGLLGMPVGDVVYGKDFVNVLLKKYDAKAFKSMVVYIEACESGSIFEGLLPNDISIYATTAADAKESSYAAYCPIDYPDASEYDTCLGDVYSIAWMEDSEKHDMGKESLEEQYKVIRRRTAFGGLDVSSHVMQYGNLDHSKEVIATYIGTNPANDNYTFLPRYSSLQSPRLRVIDQRDAHLLYLRRKFHKAPDGSEKKLKAQKELMDEISHRQLADYRIGQIGHLLFGQINSSKVLRTVRPQGQPLVDDWDCFKALVKTYETHCERLSRYGMKHTRAIVNMCNAGVRTEQMTVAAIKTCSRQAPPAS